MIKEISLGDLHRRYPTALYSYFRLKDLGAAARAFLYDSSTPPRFAYLSTVNRATIQERIASLHADIAKVSDPAAQHFLHKRLQEKQILQQFQAMHEKYTAIPPEAVQRYVQAQIELYGPMDQTLFDAIVQQLEGKASSQALFEPEAETFTRYRNLLQGAMPDLWAYIQKLSLPQDSASIEQAFSGALKATGANKAGWRVKITPLGSNIITSKHRRMVLVSDHWRPPSLIRYRQMILHEVGGHVQRSMHGITTMADDEEGLAIMLEQLMARRFMHKRAMRYLAIGIALGMDDGQPKDFCATFDKMVRAMGLLGKTPSEARARAFYETARVFRGGIPSVPGVAYIKDKVYLESNMRVWRQLSQNRLTAPAFAALFTGDMHV